MAPIVASGNWERVQSLPGGGGFLRDGINSSQITMARFTPHQQHVAQVLALTAASISLVLGLITSYWLLMMRRNFRHHLVMLLILSNMLKAFWTFTSPIIILTNGPLQSSSAFCQASGFFLAGAIEASDVAVLMIAIHTALYILKPPKSLGKAGLYPYRYYAYAIWVFFPLVMASLAFINPKGAYISQVSFCYLHIRPYWYRIALSWVPRYLIFCTIIIVYVTVYAYVKLQFSGFKGDYKQAHQENDAWLGDGKKHQDETYDLVHREPLRGPADEPKLISHGLLASSGEVSSATLGSRETSEGSSTHPGSEVVTTSSIRIPKPVVARVQPSWEALTFNTVPSSLMTVEEEPPPRSSSTTDSDEDSASITPDFRSAIQPSHHSSRGKMSIIQALNVQPPPTLHIRDRMHTSGDQELSTESANGAFLDGSGPDFNGEQLRKRRKQSLYQVGFLFLYPLVYILMWIVPFVNHCLLYSDDYIQHPSFGLTCAQIVSVILQCAVDCLVFSAREAPWKHIPGSRRTFWDSFLFWTHDLSRENQLWGGNPLHLSSLAGSLSPSLRAPTSSTAQWAGHHLRPGDLQTEMALQARGRFLRSQSDRRRRLVFMRRKLGTKKEKLWWEVEGAWKNDSGLLGEEVARERRRLGLDESSGDEGDTDEEIV